jgi:hypothetical protein
MTSTLSDQAKAWEAGWKAAKLAAEQAWTREEDSWTDDSEWEDTTEAWEAAIRLAKDEWKKAEDGWGIQA